MKLDTSTPKIIAEITDGIGWLTFNQPEKRNAMSLEMWQGMGEVLDVFAADDTVRVVVMQGAGGRAFISGADISQFEQHRNSAEASDRYNAIAGGARAKLAALTKPVIAKIEGFCIGGGLAVAMGADYRIASSNSEFGVPAARLSIIYPFEGIKALQALVGPGNAKKILFTGYRYPAPDAMRMGLIEEMTTPEDLDAVVLKHATTIAANAPLSIAGSKETIRELAKDEAERDVARIVKMGADAMDSEDYAEGRRAFMEKRKPVFRGK